MKNNGKGYPKDVTQRAWTIMDTRREKSRQDTVRRREEIHNKIPEIREIEAEMRRTGAEISRAIVLSPKEAQELILKLGRENQDLQNRRTQRLLDHGFAKDYLEETYVCNKCDDTGYVGVNRCSCFEEVLRKQAFSQLSNVSKGEEINFENFSLNYYSNEPDPGGKVIPRERMADIYKLCQKYARNFSLESDSLLMLGRTGLGKTHLSLAIAWEVIEQGYGVIYTPVQQLMDKLEANKFSYDSNQKERYTQDLNAVLQCDLLVLDDLGTEFNTSYTVSTLYNIVNTRLVESRPTIINTNMEPGELEKEYSQRMISRLMFGYKPLRFFGEDIRFLKRKQGK